MVNFSKTKIISLITVLFILLFFNYGANKLTYVYSEKNEDISQKINYYSTSPIEYFNETKHPRYSLVTRPIDLIVSPNKGRPVIIEYNENFTVAINSSYLPDDWELRLINTENEIELDILDYSNIEEGRILTVKPSVNIEGLYDIQFNGSNSENDYQTHSVKVVEQKEYPYKFIHLSDSHFPCFGDINTTDINLKYIETIKNLDVDFAIFTGDLIEGGPAWLFVNPVDDLPLAAEIQLKLGLWALDLLDMPVYIVAGNHDLDKSTIIPDNPRKIWEKYLGANPVITSFWYLDWMYIGYSVTESGLSSSQFAFVKEEIGIADKNNKPSVMFYHYNFANQASDIRKSYDIEVMLYGHEHDERLYTKDHTLYHCEAPMYENSSSIFTVLNGTSISLDEIVHDFSVLLQETTESSFSSLVVLLLTTICVSCIKLRRKRKIINQ